MSDANLRSIIPESESAIQPADRVILNGASVIEFGDIVFDKENFETYADIEGNYTLVDQVSSDITNYVNERINSIIVPEILCLYFKEFTNSSGLVIGQQTIATTNISLDYFQVSTIAPSEVDENIVYSVDASGLEETLTSDGLNLSPGIYKVECTGSFTLAGPAGSFNVDGSSNGNGDRGYLTLELFSDTAPNKSLLVSTPIIDYAGPVTITAAPTSWCGTQEEWEFYLKNNYTTPATQVAYMYGFISVCKISNIKLKAHTAGSYMIGYPNPDSASDLPPSLYNPIQITFEKISDDPFEFTINDPETDILSTVPQTRTTTLSTVSAETLPTIVPTISSTPPTVKVIERSGERSITSPGVTTWIVPENVTSISIVAIGGGGGGAATNDKIPNGGNGGDLRWRNNVPVVPGSKIWVKVGAGGASYASNIDNRDTAGGDGGDTEVRLNNSNGALLLRAAGGIGGRVGNVNQPANRGNSTTKNRRRGIGGGDGGRGGKGATPEDATAGGGGGGAGGYTDDGGDGGNWNQSGRNGRGGGGGGGSGGKGTGTAGGGGGGTGLYGEGVNGDGGELPNSRANGKAGKTGSRNLHNGIDLNERNSFGLEFGGGGGGKGEFMGAAIGHSNHTQHGSKGAVRIIFGPNRSFPDDAR